MIILHELCCLKTLDALQQGLGIRSRGADRQSPTLPIQICRQTEPEPHPIRDVRRRCCRCRPTSAQQQLNYCKYAGALGRRRAGGGQVPLFRVNREQICGGGQQSAQEMFDGLF